MPRPSRAPATPVAALCAVVSLALTACGAADTGAGTVRSEAERRVVTVDDAPAVPAVVAATDALGRRLLAPRTPPPGSDCSAPQGPNAVASPASLAVALALLTEGAGTGTRDALDAALGATGTDRTDAFNALTAAVGRYDGDPAVVQEEELPRTPVLHLADQAVVDDDLTPAAGYLDALAEGFGAGVQHTDLGGDEGKAILDAWTAEHTGGLIDESAVTPDPSLRLVLQNAVLLAARWQQPFTETLDAEPFTLADGATVRAEAVRGTLDAPSTTHDGWQAVRLPYTEGFHADLLLPPGTGPGGDGAPAPPDEDTWAALDAALAATDPGPVALTMPTLDLRTGPVDLCAALHDAGLGELYGTPDLSGISDQDLALTQAFQQVVLQVDAQGTVAAALTELGMAETAMPVGQVTLTVDRPYLLRIAHTDTSWPLFLAAVGDPRH